MNLTELRARLAQLTALARAAQERAQAAVDAANTESRARTPEESATIATARAEFDQIEAEQTELRELEARLVAAEAAAGTEHPTGVPGDDEGRSVADQNQQTAARTRVQVGREPRTYERFGEHSYLRDITARSGKIAVPGAEERLRRHAAEVRVDLPRIEARQRAAMGGYAEEIRADGERSAEIGYERRDLDRDAGDGGEFVPPLWLVEDYVGLSRASRVTANLCNRMPLPPGTDSINIPTIATGTTTAIQTADNAAVSETDATTSSVTAGVKTIAGQQDVSLQLLEQSPIPFDRVILGDLAEDHAVRTDVQVISGSNASGQVRGIENITSVDTTSYTDASPTVPELYPKIADSANVIATTRYRTAEAIIMHPRRWFWILAAVDSSNRPLVLPMAQGPQNALGSISGNVAEGAVGMTAFGPVFIDPNIPTTNGGGTEDIIILTRPSELYLWEGPIRTRVLHEVGSGTLTVRFQLWNYLAFMPDRRAENTSIVSGTGLAAPTF